MSSKTAPEIVAEVYGLLRGISESTDDPPTHMALSRSASDAISHALSAPDRLRRTRVGRWVIDGRTYRTKALALRSARDRFMAPIWPVLLASGRRFVLAGNIGKVTASATVRG